MGIEDESVFYSSRSENGPIHLSCHFLGMDLSTALDRFALHQYHLGAADTCLRFPASRRISIDQRK